jgi:hypothetical protein
VSTNVGKIIVTLGADVSELKSGFADALKSLGSFGAMAAKVAGIGAALGGGLALVGKALAAQAEQESAINKLNLALANQGNLIGGVSQRLQDYASAVQQTTTFSDEAVLAAESILASFGMTGAQIEKTTATALDFAAATGTDLESAASLLGKAFAGNTSALSRYGVVIDETLPKSERFGAVMAQLSQRFGGAAAAETATYSGQLKMLGNSFDEAQQALGKLLGEVLGLSTPFGGLISAVNAVATFIGRDLVIALGEARAQFSEFAASALESVAGLLGKLESLPVIGSKFAGLKDGLLGFAGGLRSSAEGFRSESDAAAIAAGKTLTFANSATHAGQGLHELTEAQKKAIEAAKQWAAQVDKLVSQLSGAAAREEMLQLTVAFVKAGGASGMTSKQFEDLHGRVLDLVAAGAQIPPVMQQAGLAIQQGLGRQTNIADPFPRSTKTILDLWHATDGAKKATVDWSQELADLAHSFEVLGISADSSLGRILGGLTAGAAALDKFQLKGEGGKGFSLTGGEGMSKEGIGNLLGNLSAGMQVASAAVGIGKAIFSLFTSSPAEKAAKAAGAVLGVQVSKSLAEAIAADSKNLGISMQSAALLALPKAMAESGKDASSFAGSVNKLMDAIKSGAVPAAQGLKSLGEAFTKIKDAAVAAGTVGDAALVGIIKRARELGQTTPEMKAFVGEQVDLAISGLDKLIGAMTSVSAEGATDQATIFAATFQAAMAEKGLVGAVEALSPMFDKLKEQMAGMGDVAGADAILAPFQRLHDLMGNEMFAGAANAASGLKDILTGLANAGYLDLDTFTALQNQAVQSFGVMTDQGATSKEALSVLAPTIQAAISAAEQFGVPLSADMEHLKAMAEANGIAFNVDPMQRMVQVLEAIAIKLGADIPAAVGHAADSVAAKTGEMANTAGTNLDNMASRASEAAKQMETNTGTAFDGMVADSLSAVHAIQGHVSALDGLTVSIPVVYTESGIPELPGGGGGEGGGGGGIKGNAHYGGGHASGFDAIARTDGYLKFHRGERVNVMPAGDSPMSREIAEHVAAMVGGGGDRESDEVTYQVTVPLHLDDRVLGEAVFELSKNGRLRVHSTSVVEH